MIKTTTGPMTRYGLPAPDHKFAQAHPTISSRILDRLAHGAVTPKPNIAELDDDRVHFTDGTSVEADLVIYCTGYNITFPFFDKAFFAAVDNELDLYKHMIDPGIPGLYFVGLIQPLGAIMPIAERQSLLIADHLAGTYTLPSQDAMRRDIDRNHDKMRKRYVASKRHTIQADFDDYMRELHQERRAGARRAHPRQPMPIASFTPPAHPSRWPRPSTSRAAEGCPPARYPSIASARRRCRASPPQSGKAAWSAGYRSHSTKLSSACSHGPRAFSNPLTSARPLSPPSPRPRDTLSLWRSLAVIGLLRFCGRRSRFRALLASSSVRT
jgi:hypothetical protein